MKEDKFSANIPVTFQLFADTNRGIWRASRKDEEHDGNDHHSQAAILASEG
jgi:hypothetical protein